MFNINIKCLLWGNLLWLFGYTRYYRYICVYVRINLQCVFFINHISIKSRMHWLSFLIYKLNKKKKIKNKSPDCQGQSNWVPAHRQFPCNLWTRVINPRKLKIAPKTLLCVAPFEEFLYFLRWAQLRRLCHARVSAEQIQLYARYSP